MLAVGFVLYWNGAQKERRDGNMTKVTGKRAAPHDRGGTQAGAHRRGRRRMGRGARPGWAFLKKNPGLRTDGHNIFLYHHPANRQLPMEVDFGVEVIRPFEKTGDVYQTETPAGRVATALHLGSYARMKETHDAIHAWAKANHENFDGKSWEIYGDPQPDESKTEVRIEYLLA